MKKFTLLFFLSMLFTIASYGQLFTVAGCSNLDTSTYGPMYSIATVNATNRTAVVYPSSQLTGISGQTLTSLYFKRVTATGSMAAGGNFKIYLKESTATDFGASSLTWASEIATATLVYNSDPSVAVGSSAGWKGFPLSTNFVYSGVQNLIVLMEYTNPTASTAITWNYEYTAPCISTSNSSTTKYNNNTTGVPSATLASQDYRRPFIGFDFLVSCNAPNTLTTSNVTTTTATATWVANATAPQNGYEYYYSTSATPPTPTATPNGTTAAGIVTANLSSLTSGTTYYLWVRGNCGATDKSIWAGPSTFTTVCTTVTDYVQSFDSSPTGTGNLPNCWSKLGSSANVYTTTGSVAPMSPANRLYMNISATTTAFAILPPVSNLQAGTHRLKFKAYATAASKKVRVGYFTNPTDASTFVQLVELDLPGTTTATATDFTVIPTGIPAGITNLVLSLPDGAITTAYFDDFKWEIIPACPDQTGLVVGAITSNGASVSWDAITGVTGYEYAVTTSATPPATGTATTNTFAVISSLAPQTVYYLHVRTTCAGNNFGLWSTSLSFTTACAIITAPVLEPFATFLPNCWTNLFGGDLVTGPTATTGSGWVADGFANVGTTGAIRNEIFTTGANDWIVSPVINIPATGYELKFDAAATQFGTVNVPTTAWEADDTIEVLVSTTGTTNWTTLFTYNSGNQPSNTGTPNIIGLNAYANQNIRIAFRAVEGAANGSADIDFSIDNFEVRLAPACSEPQAIVTGNIQSASVDISWSQGTNAPSVGYQYVVSTSNVAPTGAGTPVAVTFASVSALSPQTTYYVFVRSDCGASGFSSWTGPIAFTTACGIINAPVLEPFTTFLPNCWSNRFGGDLATGPAATGTSGWVADGFANNGTTGAIRNEIFTTGANDWVISPQINIPATGYELKFDAAATQFATVSAPTTAWEADDTIEVLVSTTGLTNWTPLFTYNSGNQPSNTGTPNIINLNAYANQNIRIAFRAVEGAVNGAADIDFSIDNFQIRLTPSCPEVQNIVSSGVTTSSINISWDATIPAPAVGYEYVVSTSNVAPTGAGTATTNTFASISSLTAQTSYYVFVRAVCSATDFGAWVGPITFYTGHCLPSSTAATSYINNFTTTGGSQNISNLATGFTTGGYLNASSQSVQGFATSSFNFNAEIVGGTVGFAIWVDWNNDLIFDNATEKVFNTTAYGNGPFTGSVTIPAATAIGNYRMRIVTDFNNSNPNEPCALRPRAEYEDYTISVIAPPACGAPSPTVSNVLTASATLSWAAVPTATVGYEYVLDNVATNPTGAGTAISALTYSPAGLAANTTYYFHLRSVCGAGSFSTWSTISFTTACGPDNVPYTQNFESATVPNLPLCTSQQNVGTGNSWTVANNSGYGFTTNALRYAWNASNAANVWFYTNGINLVGGTAYKISYDYGGTGTTFVEKLKVAYGTSALATAMTTPLADHPNVVNATPINNVVNFTPATSGVYYFGFNAYSDLNKFYLQVDNISIDVALANNDFNSKSFSVYPNPVKDVLNIDYADNVTKIQIVNMLGQEVMNKSVNNTQNQIDMSGLVSGTYLVKVTANDVVKTIKVIKQ